MIIDDDGDVIMMMKTRRQGHSYTLVNSLFMGKCFSLFIYQENYIFVHKYSQELDYHLYFSIFTYDECKNGQGLT